MPEYDLSPFLALPEAERRVLSLFAAAHEALTRSDMVELLKLAEFRTANNRQFNTQDLTRLVETWTAAGWLVELPSPNSRNHYRVLPTHVHAMLGYLRGTPQLTQLVHAVRARRPLLRPYSYSADVNLLAREVMLAAYGSKDPDFERAFGYYRAPYGGGVGDVFVLALGLNAPMDAIKSLGLERAQAYLECAFAVARQVFLPLGEGVLEYLRATRDMLTPEVTANGAQYLILRGDLGAARAVLVGLSHAEISAANCLLNLAEADFPAARGHARHAIEQTSTKKSKKIKGLAGPLWPWVLLALLTDTEAASSLVLARAQLEALASGRREFDGAARALLRFERFVSQPDASNAAGIKVDDHLETWMDMLVSAVVHTYAEQSPSKKSQTRLAACAASAKKAGFEFLASLLGESGVVPAEGVLGRLYAREEAWMRTVRALETTIELADRAEAGPAQEKAQERLVWLLNLKDDGSHELSARIQSQTSRGFSSGRLVSWKKLVESAAEVSWMSEADRRVVAHVKAERDSTFYGGASTSYEMSEDAPIALIGHPLVFVDEGRTPIEVVRGSVRMDVREEGGTIAISLTPAGSMQRPVLCEREGEHRVSVYALSAGQRLIAAQLSKQGLRLPQAARGSIERSLAKLTSHFPVASEMGVESESIEQTAADARLHLQLRRAAAGLLIRPCVAPLGPTPTFAPGVGSASVLGVLKGQAGAVKTVRCVRDLADEARRLESLLSDCPRLAESEWTGREYRVLELDACLEVLCELGALSQEVVLEWPEGQPLSIAAERGVRDVRLKVNAQANWLAAEGELEVDDELKLSLRELLERTGRTHGRFVQLDDGRFLALSEDLRRNLDSLSGLSRTRQGQLEVHPLALFGMSHMVEADIQADAASAAQLSRIREASVLEPALPAAFQASLRPYQLEGYAWLSRLAHWGGGACLADDMGLGKTLQALALLVERAPHGPSLVVAPTSVCANWQDEARKFAPTLRVIRLVNAGRERALAELGPGDVVVVSYGVLQQDAELFEKTCFEVVVLDEAQTIKNATALRTKAALGLQGKMRVALTGTPVENHLGELWSIMNFLNPGLLGSAPQFEERFGKAIQRDRDLLAAQRLKRLVRPFMLRRKKGEVLEDLPEKTVLTLRVEPSESERALFAALREQALERMKDPTKPAEARMRLLAELTRLRRAACHPSLVAPEVMIESSKLSAFEGLLEELRQGGHRVLVFSQFVDYLSIVRARLDALAVSYQYLDGSSSPASRAESVRAFQAGQGDAFLISLKAGGFGLNLTAADYVIHLDPWWNPAVEDQASDRAHRIGQTRPVTIYRLVMQGSIEEKILALHAEKRDLADRLLDGGPTASALGVEELLDLLQEAGGDSGVQDRKRRKARTPALNPG